MATKKTTSKTKTTTKKAEPKKVAKKSVKKAAKKADDDELYPNVKVEKHGESYEVFRSNEAGGFKHEIVSENPLPENESE